MRIKFLSACLADCALVICSFRIDAAQPYPPNVKESPLSAFADPTLISAEYREWQEHPDEGLMPPIMDLSYLEESYAAMEASNARRSRAAAFPESFDLRDQGKGLHVRDQGNLSTCWAIAALESAVQTSLADQDPTIMFSDVHTAWFAYMGAEEEAGFRIPNPLTRGGNDNISVGVLGAWKGPVLNEKLSYSASLPPDESLRYEADYHLQDAFYLGRSYVWANGNITRPGDRIIKQLVTDYGPATISLNTAKDEYFNSETAACYCPQRLGADHEVQIIGWDDHYSRENFNPLNQPPHDGAWLLCNSWGSNWGNDGYFWVSYYDQSISAGMTMLLEERDNYARNYQYDTLGWMWSTSTNSITPSTGKAANIFEAESNEMIEAVSFYTTDASVEYSVSIYTGVHPGEPESGSLVHSQSGSEIYAGYHTIELDQPIALSQGDLFSIVVEWTNPNNQIPVAVELYQPADINHPEPALGTGNESYIYDPAQKIWKDAAGRVMGNYYLTNVCIKAFTNPLPQSNAPVPTVRFSQMAGQVRDGTELSLDAIGADSIVYMIDGSEEKEYTAPIQLLFDSPDQTHTITAWARNEQNEAGNPVTRTYRKARAELISLKIFEDQDKYDVGLSQQDRNVVIGDAESIQIRPVSADQVRVDGKPVERLEKSDPIFIPRKDGKTIEIEVSGEGKETTLYRLTVHRAAIQTDFEQETVSFPSKFHVEDANGNPIRSGQSISSLLSGTDELILTIHLDGDESSVPHTCRIPGRIRLADISIDYLHETTAQTFTDGYAYRYPIEQSTWTQTEDGKPIHLQPGKTLQIRKLATADQFQSEIFDLHVPSRPASPSIELSRISASSIALIRNENVEYGILRADSSVSPQDSVGRVEWQSSAVFNDLDPEQDYLLFARRKAFDTQFCSSASTLLLKTWPDLSLLQEAYNTASVLNLDDFIPESAAGFDTCLTQAEEVLNNPAESTTLQGTLEALKLNKALLALRKHPFDGWQESLPTRE